MISCPTCPIYDKCGGLVVDGETELSCMYRCGQCRSKKGECPFACPNNIERLVYLVAEVQFLDYTPRAEMWGPSPRDFPLFVPQILHGSSRWKPLELSPVAISIRDLLSGTNPADDARDVRRKFRLADDTQIIALGVGPDYHLERWWGSRLEVASRLMRMDLLAVTTPNFSIFHNAPRYHTLVSIARIHHFSETLSAVGQPVIPHVYAETDLDWIRWKNVLQAQPHIHMIAMEFQTTRDDLFAHRYISKLARLQQEVGRELHLVAVGGARYARELLKAFPNRCTVTEASSFTSTLHRRRVTAPANDPDRPTLTPSCDLADLLEQNILQHEARVRRRAKNPAMSGLRRPAG